MSSLTLISGPTAEPVSLAEAKAQCRVISSDEDGLIGGYLLAARAHCEDFTHRVFTTQTWAMTIDGGWPSVFDQCTVMRHTRIVLPNPPAQSVTGITYVDTTGTLQTLAPSQYVFSKGDMHGYIDQAFGVSWPQARNQPDTISVQFVAGYGVNPSKLPEPIRQAILMLVAHFFDNREPVVGIVTRAVPSEMPFAVSALLSRYVTEGWV